MKHDKLMKRKFVPLVDGEQNFNDVFQSYVVIVGSDTNDSKYDKQRRGRVYIGGSHDANMTWRVVYGTLKSEWLNKIKPHMCDGKCQSMHLYKMRDGSNKVYAWAMDSKYISSRMACWIDRYSIPKEVMDVVFGSDSDKEIESNEQQSK